MEAMLENDDTNFTVGKRIVDIDILANNLTCKVCEDNLLLKQIKREIRAGLHSTFTIKCKKCGLLNQVDAGKVHLSKDNRKRADINTKVVFGALHAGIGCTALNKVLACANLPGISKDLFKRSEREVGPAIEAVAKESCKSAAEEERQLVIQKIDELCKDLPEEVVQEIYPLHLNLRSYINAAEDSEATDVNISSENIGNFDQDLGEIINIIVSYDMGWSKRGNGRSYDSLNGYGCIIGFLSGKVLDYETCNRKCLLCDLGHPKDDHDCRLNFQGSAKAMEPTVGASLANNSPILKESGLQVRVLIGDEDSSTISAVRKGTTKTIFKFSDKNHLQRSFNTDLYGLRVSHNEMKKKGVVEHIRKCLSYAIAQNKGKNRELAAAMLAIPDHLFNHHENCGSWCRRGEPNSENQTVLLKSINLYNALKAIFTKYSKSSEKFCIAASSQANKSINNIMAHKAPKNCCYSRSESADYRYASAICTKNEGDSHIMAVNEKLSLSPGKHTKSFTSQMDRTRLKRTIKCQLPSTKRRRIILSKKRDNLRQKNEKLEGVQYQTNCGFLNLSTQSTEELIDQASYVDFPNVISDSSKIVYFDLETSGFHKTDEILQIAAQYDECKFNVYITPTKEINPEASEHTGLKNINGQLYLRHDKVLTVCLEDALRAFKQFLSKFKEPCLLVAHNASFDVSHLVRAILKCDMVNDFTVICGFCDSLPLLKKHFNERSGEGAFKLETLAKELLQQESTGAFHEASYDVYVLKSLVSSYLDNEDIFKNAKTYADSVNHVIELRRINTILPSLKPLKDTLKNGMLRKLAKENLTFEILQKKFDEEGEEGLLSTFTLLKNGKPQVTKNKRILAQILTFFKTKNKCN
ncbi:unnamed protein product [Brassicogethes aeneus]|uniref:Exonuclease domain-containing protein n=1 Tax=Brassicogethes aeneus TaxID=1431903 RepID=A0A9P0B4A7_BRAAE|nr:unnamed protein product [Brassicogethes aeneus]